MSDDDSYYTAESEDYFTAEEDGDWLHELGFVLWVSRDGTPWYLPYDERPVVKLHVAGIGPFAPDLKS